MRSTVVLALELMLVSLGIFLADFLQAFVEFIPSALIKLPEVDYTRHDFHVVLAYFLATHTVVFLILRWRLGVWRLADSKRTAEELFGLAFAYSISALLLFITSSVAFDPNFIVGIALVTAALVILLHLVVALISRRPPLDVIKNLARAITQRLFTISGVLILLVALSPGVLAKLFVSDRDVANVITQIRIYFSQDTEGSYSFIPVLGGRTFSQPMLAKSDPTDQSRLYVLERSGRLVVLDYPHGEDLSVVLDIGTRVGYVESENGALGFDFHPNFGLKGEVGERDVFVYYTTVHDGEQENRLSRFTLSGDDTNSNAEGLALIVLPREASGYHNGGSVEFGPDGFLYLAIGEGVHTKESWSQAETLRGGILRIDVDCQGQGVSHETSRQPAFGSTEHYCIPVDNPFLDQPELMDEYWALGLRNPYRVTFDPQTGLMWAGDVGSTKWEEVNIIQRGANYQYPFVEGYEETGGARPEVVYGLETAPIYTYIHTAYDRAVIGGVVYRGSEFPELEGKYLFADNYSSRIFSMAGSGDAVAEVTHIATANQYAQRGTSSLTQLPNGDVLVTTLGRSAVATGEVLKLSALDAEYTQITAAPSVPEYYSAEEIKMLYTGNCARCHGSAGGADGPDSAILGVALPDFTVQEQLQNTTDEQLRNVISKGGLAGGMSPLMPAWGHLLSEAEVEGLIVLLREFSKNDSP